MKTSLSLSASDFSDEAAKRTGTRARKGAKCFPRREQTGLKLRTMMGRKQCHHFRCWRTKIAAERAQTSDVDHKRVVNHILFLLIPFDALTTGITFVQKIERIAQKCLCSPFHSFDIYYSMYSE